MTKVISTTLLITAIAGSLVAAAAKSDLSLVKGLTFSKPVIADQMWPTPTSGKPPSTDLNKG